MENIITTPVLLPFGKTILQTSAQGISNDSKLLVDAVLQEDRTNLQVLELGSGNGIVSIMLAHERVSWNITGIEIQKNLVELARKNCISAEVIVKFIEADLKNFISENKFDVIISNPPYFPKNEGRISPIYERAISRHEILCNMQNVLETIANNLKKNGIAYIIYPENRFAQLEELSKKVDLRIENKKVLNIKNKIIIKLSNLEGKEC